MSSFFTYGTFMTDECRNFILLDNGGQFIKAATTAPKYKLLNLGSFPGVIDGEAVVVGELYDIPECALEVFDRIEGVPFLFDRKQVELEDGTTAIAYMFQGSADDAAEIKSGNWKHRRDPQ